MAKTASPISSRRRVLDINERRYSPGQNARREHPKYDYYGGTDRCGDRLVPPFLTGQITRIRRAPPPMLWHLNNGEGLIGIIESSNFWATQVACLRNLFPVDGASSLSDLRPHGH